MEDSFFGFDTSVPLEDDGGGLEEHEAPEDVYDALNDETFGSAIKGDWEKSHEHLVKLDGFNGSESKFSFEVDDDEDDDDDEENSDLEMNFSRVRLDDVDIGTDDNESRIQLDPSVWANPLKLETNSSQQNHMYTNPEAFLRQHFSNPFEILPNQSNQNSRQHQQSPSLHFSPNQSQQQIQKSNIFGLPTNSALPPKICTVEDIERNIRNQQQQHQLQQQQQQIQLRASTPKLKSSISNPQSLIPPATQHQSQIPQVNGNFFNRSVAPPGFTSPRPNFNLPPQHPLNMMATNSAGNQHRMPPGFPPMPSMPGNNNGTAHPNFPRQMPNLVIALNNFAMHPNFNAIRTLGPQMNQPRMPPHPAMMNHNMMPQNGQVLGQINSGPQINQFNQRLMQEIQQNHPMLSNNRIPPMFNQLNLQQQMQSNIHGINNHNNSNRQQHLHQHDKSNSNKQNLRSNGNLPEEYDEYANLMSTRDKHWLIGIQLSQLNTETPYIDDYYYTTYKENKAKQNGETGQSKAHKDNQLNHPFSQPKGHAQLVLISMGNKNGTQNHHNRNGQNNRERRNSETNNKDKDQQQQQQRNYTHTPLQFENSLGKLQYGSVTAPRKIIDMDVMGSESNSQLNTSIEISAQRKSRHILLHIETLYRIVLKLEDLENPAAIASSIVVKERKEKEKLLNLEQSFMSDLNKLTGGQDFEAKIDSSSTSVNSSVSEKYSAFELESKDKLISKLLPCLTLEKIIGMMSVRKGKTLIRRMLIHIEDNPIRWTVWNAVFQSLPSVLKKDKDDSEGVLYALYPELKRQIGQADLDIVINIGNAMPLNDKKLNGFFSSKFCISSLIAVLLRAEEIYKEKQNFENDKNNSNNMEWSEFLLKLSIALNRTIENQTVCAAIEKSAIAPMVAHLSRFKDLQLDPLIALFTQAKQQIN